MSRTMAMWDMVPTVDLSDYLRPRKARESGTCERCGRPVGPETSRNHLPKRFCSELCRKRAERARWKAKWKAKRREQVHRRRGMSDEKKETYVTPSDEQINVHERIEAQTISEMVSKQTLFGIICMLRVCANDARAPGPSPNVRSIKPIDCDQLYEFLNAIADRLECLAGLRKEGGAK